MILVVVFINSIKIVGFSNILLPIVRGTNDLLSPVAVNQPQYWIINLSQAVNPTLTALD
jgi:heme/copper-type cytochrome/quinol oxidase subunit 1